MEIKLLELIEYKRLMLKNIVRFQIIPTEPQQLILGTNGSGKSSVMDELSPLPALAANFTKEGSKTIEISHNGSFYRLKSVFKPSAKHSFEKDGEELNEGGTASVQKQLVEYYFGITQEIHDLEIGSIKFHNMSPSDRRIWFTRLSEVSYDYAINIFNQLKVSHRDTAGALKMAKNRLVEEVPKLLSEEEERKLRRDIDNIHKELEVLREHRNPTESSPDNYRMAFSSVEKELVGLATKMLKISVRHPKGSSCKSVEDVEDQIGILKIEYAKKEAILVGVANQHEKLQSTVDGLRKAGAEGIVSLQEKIKGLREERDSILKQRKLGIEVTDVVSARSAIDTIYEALSGTLEMLPSNEDRRFSQGKLDEARKELTIVRDAILVLTSRINKAISSKDHFEAHKANGNTECPKCKHVWIQGFNDVQYEKALKAIEELSEERSKLCKQEEALDVRINEIMEYSALYRDYSRFVNNFPALDGLWDKLNSERLVIDFPRKAKSVLDVFISDLDLSAQARQVELKIEEATTLLEATVESGGADVEEASERLELLSQEVSELTDSLKRTREELSDYLDFKSQVQNALSLADRVNKLALAASELKDGEVEALKQEILGNCIRNAQSLLAKKEHVLSDVNQQKALIKDLEMQIERYTKEESALKELVKQLSPTEGLIAEGLLGFIRNFTNQMNNLIRKIWSYPLHVLDCSSDGSGGADLDYKFPLMVQHRNNIVPDISKGSTAQKDVVDFAFMVVARRYLRLTEAPLFLDEFGASFDEAHRVAGIALIKSMMEQQSFKQLFMVSHYATSHGALVQAQVCVLDPSNITVPSKYNDHVIIE